MSTELPDLRVSSPGWGAEGIRMANMKKQNKRALARDLLLQQQEARSDRPGQWIDAPTRYPKFGGGNYNPQLQLQQPRPPAIQVQQQKHRVPQVELQSNTNKLSHSTEIVLSSDRRASELEVYDSASLERLLIEERTKRSLMQAELERVSALATRNQNMVRDRSAFLEKLRLRDAIELRNLRERLQQVEQELTEQRAAGLSSTSGNLGNQRSASSGGAQLTSYQFRSPVNNNARGSPREQATGTSKDNISSILSELRSRDQRDKLVLEKQEQKRLELWEQNMALQRRVEEQRQQMSEYALRSADRIAAIESRLNERDSSITRLEQKESGTSQQLAMRNVQSDATVASLMSSIEQLQSKLAQEQQMRTKMEEAQRASNAELRRLIFSSEKNVSTAIQMNIDELWQRDAADRARSKQTSEFVEQRHLHERDSVYQWAERLEATLASERNDRLRFEKEMRTMTELRVAAIEAGAQQAKTSNQLHGADIEKKTEKVLNKLIKMVTAFKSQSEEQRVQWERETGSGIEKLRNQINEISNRAGHSTQSLEQILRAEIKVRKKQGKESVEEAMERERTIDGRARAVEASLRAAIDGFEARIKAVEERVNGALAGFRAQMDNDIKTSTDSMAKMLLDLDGSVQMLSIRIDTNDAERRSSLAGFKRKLSEVTQMTVSRAELDAASAKVRSEALNETQSLSLRLDEIEKTAVGDIANEVNEREQETAQLKKNLVDTANKLHKAINTKLDGAMKEITRVTDRERTDRIKKDAQHSQEAGEAREALEMRMKQAIERNFITTKSNLDESLQDLNRRLEERIGSAKSSTLEVMDTKLAAAKSAIDTRCSEIVKQTGNVTAEATDKATKADANAGVALSKINAVVETSETKLSKLSSELRSLVTSGYDKQVKDSETLVNDVEKRMSNIEASLRRSFEEQTASLRALTQANLAAEAAVRLREDTRVRQEVDARLREQQKWVGEFTDYKSEKTKRAIGKMVREESQARRLATMQVQREMTYEIDSIVQDREVRSAMDYIITSLVELHNKEEAEEAGERLERKVLKQLKKEVKDRMSEDQRIQVLTESKIQGVETNLMEEVATMKEALQESQGSSDQMEALENRVLEEEQARGEEDKRIENNVSRKIDEVEQELKAEIEVVRQKLGQIGQNNENSESAAAPPEDDPDPIGFDEPELQEEENVDTDESES